MSVLLVCDFCSMSAQSIKGRHLVEIRGITATHTSEIHRADYPNGQVHWDCIVPFVERANAKDQEVPF